MHAYSTYKLRRYWAQQGYGEVMKLEQITTHSSFDYTTPVDVLGKLLELVSKDDEFALLRQTLEVYTEEVAKGE